MEYIEKTLGMSVIYEPWCHLNKMPYFITDRYGIQKVTIGKVRSLFLYPKTDLDQVGTIQKHIARIQREEQLPVALVLQTINRYRREAFINAKIPFMVPDKQLYLPFIGVVLQERFEGDEIKTEKLQPAAQVLFFYYLYQKKQALYTSQAVKDLGYSAMTISRATKQLVQTGHFEEKKDGVQKILESKLDRKTVFEKFKSLLINPVRKRGYIAREKITDEFCVAGDTALARQTMINDSMFLCYAVDSKRHVVEHPYLIFADTHAAVELWRYDPTILTRDGMVDPLSLAMSMSDNEDERIEEAVEELLDKFWEE